MSKNQNVVKFPDKLTLKKKKYIRIRDDIENILFNYARNHSDLWAVSLAAGRFSAMNLQKIEGERRSIEFFENCIETQRKSCILSDS